jgi:hypothetical protein
MKIVNIFLMVFLVEISVMYASGGRDRIKGNGEIITSEQTMSPFEEIHVTQKGSNNIYGSEGKGIIRFHSNQEYRVVITIDSNLNQYVEISASDNVLKIETKKRMSRDFIVDIYCPKLLGISIDSLCRFETTDKIIVEKFKIDISGYGEIEGTIECETFLANIDGAGKITVKGSSKEADISISGACSFEGTEFKINNASISLDGVGRINSWVIDNLRASISGVGRIRYRGDPKLDFDRGGIGSIKNIMNSKGNTSTSHRRLTNDITKGYYILWKSKNIRILMFL